MDGKAALSLAADVFFHHMAPALLSKNTQPRPFLASYKLTYRCNLRCRQCPFVDRSFPEPTFDQVCATLDLLHARGDRVVILEGGEPLLWRDGQHCIHDVIRYARRLFPVIGATTNGTLPLNVETDVLWVSVDGFADTHNRLRGAEIFEHIMANISGSPHRRLYAHITANAENYAEIPDLVRFLNKHVTGITVQFYYPYGKDDQLFLPWSERRALLSELITLKRSGLALMNSTASLQALMANTWLCRPWLIDCADPNGTVWQGCYLHGRSEIDCGRCGFSPYTEISLAFQGNLKAILAGMRIFAP